MKVQLLLAGAFIAAGLGNVSQAATICPTTSFTNTDCGFVLTIGAGGAVTGAAVAGANAYDGSDDALVGVVNNSGTTFTGAIHLTSGADIFGFESDGICTFIGAGESDASPLGAYCSAAQRAGTDPADYAGPLNTFASINAAGTAGDVVITGLAAGASTFFSLEGSPSSIAGGGGITPTPPPGTVPEPATWSMLVAGIGGVSWVARRRRVRA